MRGRFMVSKLTTMSAIKSPIMPYTPPEAPTTWLHGSSIVALSICPPKQDISQTKAIRQNPYFASRCNDMQSVNTAFANRCSKLLWISTAAHPGIPSLMRNPWGNSARWVPSNSACMRYLMRTNGKIRHLPSQDCIVSPIGANILSQTPCLHWDSKRLVSKIEGP